jgi:hypothetical protein
MIEAEQAIDLFAMRSSECALEVSPGPPFFAHDHVDGEFQIDRHGNLDKPATTSAFLQGTRYIFAIGDPGGYGFFDGISAVSASLFLRGSELTNSGKSSEVTSHAPPSGFNASLYHAIYRSSLISGQGLSCSLRPISAQAP